MKKESNLIDTKDELIKNFSKEQLEIYEFYKSKFSYADKDLYPVVKKDKELAFLENGCKLLTKVLKAEIVIALVVFTVMFMFKGFSKPDIQYKQANITRNVSNTKIL